LVAPCTDVVGYECQKFKDGKYGEKKVDFVTFICTLIKRRVINEVGYLNEQLIGYGYEDNEYCKRVRKAGYEIVVVADAFVKHNHWIGEWNKRPDKMKQFELNRKLMGKWA